MTLWTMLKQPTSFGTSWCRWLMFEYEFDYIDHLVIFDIIEIDDEEQTVTVAISEQGKITQDTFVLFEDSKSNELEENRYFEYGVNYDKIYIDDFVCM